MQKMEVAVTGTEHADRSNERRLRSGQHGRGNTAVASGLNKQYRGRDGAEIQLAGTEERMSTERVEKAT